jgi:hypothetical protein
VLLLAQCPLRELSVVTDTAKRAPTTKVERAIEAVLPDHVVYLNARDHCVRTSTGCAAVAFNSTEFEVRRFETKLQLHLIDAVGVRIVGVHASSAAAQQLITGKAQVEGVPAKIDSGYFAAALQHATMPLSVSSHPKHGAGVISPCGAEAAQQLRDGGIWQLGTANFKARVEFAQAAQSHINSLYDMLSLEQGEHYI